MYAPPAWRLLVGLQGAYFLFTGLWPLIHLESFLAVTGPKGDLWLVETVGILVSAIGAGLLLASVRSDPSLEVGLIAMASAAGLATIDAIYVARGRISPIYLLDFGIEVILIGAWIALGLKKRTKSCTSDRPDV
jgi:hypothetical protein